MKLRIEDIIAAGSVSAAIEAAAQESDTIASGVIGSSFACSGPGSGWQRNFGPADYAERALDEGYGALSYIDSADGREATVDEDGGLSWSEESVVELDAPDAEEVDDNLDAARRMVEALESGQCIEGGGNWDRARALVAVSEAEAVERYDLEIVGDGVVYYDDGTRKYYLNRREDLIGLRELMGSADEDVANDAYSRWCADYSAEGEYETREEAEAYAAKL